MSNGAKGFAAAAVLLGAAALVVNFARVAVKVVPAVSKIGATTGKGALAVGVGIKGAEGLAVGGRTAEYGAGLGRAAHEGEAALGLRGASNAADDVGSNALKASDDTAAAGHADDTDHVGKEILQEGVENAPNLQDLSSGDDDERRRK